MPACTVTLTAASTAYNLRTLAISAFSSQNSTAYVDRWSQVIIQSHEDNVSGAVYLGGSNVNAETYGNKIVGADEGVNLAPPNGHAHLQGLFAFSVAADAKLALLFKA